MDLHSLFVVTVHRKFDRNLEDAEGLTPLESARLEAQAFTAELRQLNRSQGQTWVIGVATALLLLGSEELRKWVLRKKENSR